MNLEQLNDLTEYPKIIAWKAVKFSISSRAKLIPRNYGWMTGSAEMGGLDCYYSPLYLQRKDPRSGCKGIPSR